MTEWLALEWPAPEWLWCLTRPSPRPPDRFRIDTSAAPRGGVRAFGLDVSSNVSHTNSRSMTLAAYSLAKDMGMASDAGSHRAHALA